jgi:peptidoglycan-associated lipoprotein
MEGGDGMMNQVQRVISMAAMAGLLGALVLAGCATKNVAVTTAGNPTTPGQAETKAAANAPLKGFSKTPVEEQVTQPAPMVVAKVEQPESQARKASEAAKRQLADIYFAFDRWGLSAEGKKYLVEDAETLKQHPEAKLVIEGYCDERGSHEYNLVLGEKRAQEAMHYLTDLGIKNPVKVISYGKERQICAEQDESCYWKNRRAHMVIESGK